MSTIGERIRKLRKINNQRQVEFSKSIGVSQGTLSELETDKYLPPIEVIMELKNKFKVDIDWLLFGNINLLDRTVYDFDQGESELLALFNKLKTDDQEEIIEIIKLKLRSRSYKR